MLLSLGFQRDWVSFIMSRVTSVSYSILVNGHPTNFITPSRGLRQGDPMAPYLFLICTEGLAALIRDATSKNISIVQEFVGLLPLLSIFSLQTTA